MALIRKFFRRFRTFFWDIFWKIKAEDSSEILATSRDISEDCFYAIYDDIVRKLKLNLSDTLLDIGCAGGVFDMKFSPIVEKVIAVDKYFNMIKRAKLNLKTCANVKVLCCDSMSLPFQDQSFSKINMYGVFPFIKSEEEMLKIFKELKRLVKDDGKILVGDIPDPLLEKNLAPQMRKNWFSRFKKALCLLLAFWHQKKRVLKLCEKVGLKASIHQQPNDLPFFDTRYDLILTK